MPNSSSSSVCGPVSAVRGRGRPRSFDRTGALDAAMRLFWQRGFAATSIADLTEAMEIGTKSLYAAYGSKEALYKETIQRYLDLHDDIVWERFSKAVSAREAVGSLLMDTVTFVTQASGSGDPCGCMVTLSTARDEGEAVLGDLVLALRGRLYDRIRVRLERAVDEGELSARADVESIARLVITLQNGLSLQARDGVDNGALQVAMRLAMKSWDAWIGE